MFLFYSLQEELLVLVGELLALKTAKDKNKSLSFNPNVRITMF